MIIKIKKILFVKLKGFILIEALFALFITIFIANITLMNTRIFKNISNQNQVIKTELNEKDKLILYLKNNTIINSKHVNNWINIYDYTNTGLDQKSTRIFHNKNNFFYKLNIDIAIFKHIDTNEIIEIKYRDFFDKFE